MEHISYGGMPCLDFMQWVGGLVLPQLKGPGFADSLWEHLLFGRSGWGGEEVGQEQGWEGEL